MPLFLRGPKSEEHKILRHGGFRSMVIDDDDPAHGSSCTRTGMGMANQRVPVMGEHDPPVLRRPFEHILILGSGEAKVPGKVCFKSQALADRVAFGCTGRKSWSKQWSTRKRITAKSRLPRALA